MLRRILVPVDGSPTSFKALEYAMGIGKAFDSELVVTHVADPYDLSPVIDPKTVKVAPGDASAKQTKEEKKKADQAALTIAKQIAEQAGYLKIAFEHSIDKDPAQRILTEAEELGMDAIVMGNRGRGSAKAFFLGSVSTKVVSHATCPVIIVK